MKFGILYGFISMFKLEESKVTAEELFESGLIKRRD